MLSMPCWVAASAWSLWKRRDIRAEYGSSKIVGGGLPTRAEYFSIRLLALYTVMDALRAMDLCFDSTDGVCRAVWGFVPWWFRCAVWVARDLALLGSIGSNLSFHLGWTYEALEWEQPRTLQMVMHGTLGIVLCAIAAAFWALMATNRQSWQAWACMFVVGLNAVWAYTNFVLLKHVVPAIESRIQAGKLLPAWVGAAVEEVRVAAKLVIIADLAILVLFPIIAFERVVLRGAHEKAFYPGMGLNEWAGNAVPPLMMQRPDGVLLNPVLEVVELLIGWLQCIYVLRVCGACISTRVPCNPPGDAVIHHGYIDEATMGSLFRSVAFGVTCKKLQ